ncbi:methyltransferase domain-containing protein [Burkholderia sp. BCC1993]|uniref:methyltransferase domain-containing protein n=1 Tax=Burkholderia sp. BCC1993 TaxID=2817444 RepID=UPI002AB1AB13|nr:methyltransferase domain-containing protein [Burkholderia sp. BCC1993]
MHPSAMENGKIFFDTYVSQLGPVKLVEIGSQNVNGSLREVAPSNVDYIGVDFVEGRGVDVILDDPYVLPFETSSVDLVVSSSCFEHSEMFWLVFSEVMRTLKPAGLFFLNVPSNGPFHRYPVDCWRFYPDSANALVTWAKRTGTNAGVLESFTTPQKDDYWNDYLAVFIKNIEYAQKHPNRMLDGLEEFANGMIYGEASTINPENMPQDVSEKRRLMQEVGRLKEELDELKRMVEANNNNGLKE